VTEAIEWPRDEWVAIVVNGLMNDASRVHSGVLAHDRQFGSVVGEWLRENRELWAVRGGIVEVSVERRRVRWAGEAVPGVTREWNYLIYHPAGVLLAVSSDDDDGHVPFATRMRARRAGA
jgi:hypothetical protein